VTVDSRPTKRNRSLIERLGLGFLAGLLAEAIFWLVVALGWFAYSGGIVGIAFTVGLVIVLGFLYWDNHTSNGPDQRDGQRHD
jgi:hypothetical protein